MARAVGCAEQLGTVRERPSLGRSLGQAALVAVVSVAVALAFNGLRSAGLPLLADSPYQTLIPCPEPGGPVAALAPGDPGLLSARTFLIDARSPREFAAEHPEGAINVPYDWLDPLPEQVLEQLSLAIAASGASRVVVYGDGGKPDSGEYLGKEISGRGIKKVFFVTGGAPAVLAAEEQ